LSDSGDGTGGIIAFNETQPAEIKMNGLEREWWFGAEARFLTSLRPNGDAIYYDSKLVDDNGKEKHRRVYYCKRG